MCIWNNLHFLMNDLITGSTKKLFVLNFEVYFTIFFLKLMAVAISAQTQSFFLLSSIASWFCRLWPGVDTLVYRYALLFTSNILVHIVIIIFVIVIVIIHCPTHVCELVCRRNTLNSFRLRYKREKTHTRTHITMKKAGYNNNKNK